MRPYVSQQVVADSEERGSIDGEGVVLQSLDECFDGVRYEHTFLFLRLENRSGAEPEEPGCKEWESVSSEFHQLRSLSNISMMRSSSVSLAKGMLILPLPLSEQVISTFVLKIFLSPSRRRL